MHCIVIHVAGVSGTQIHYTACTISTTEGDVPVTARQNLREPGPPPSEHDDDSMYARRHFEKM